MSMRHISSIQSTTTLDEILQISEKIQREFEDNVNKTEMFLQQAGDEHVFWWGTGSSSIIYINQLSDYINEERKIFVIDGDKTKSGFFASGVNIKVEPYDVLSHTPIKNLVIASSFYHGIQETMRQNNIHAKNTLVIY
jgi:hypothetical protein